MKIKVIKILFYLDILIDLGKKENVFVGGKKYRII